MDNEYIIKNKIPFFESPVWFWLLNQIVILRSFHKT